jgi:hypothetical protein
MKTIKSILPALLVVALATLAACSEKEIEYNAGTVDAVGALLEPAGTAPLVLKNSDEPVTFRWTPVSSGAVKYQIAFMATATGDAIYRFVPADGAVGGETTIPMNLLDEIADKAGIPAAMSGDLYWTVFTTSGPVEVRASAAPGKLPVERFVGMESPVTLFLTGAATEAGATLADAIRFRKETSDIFTIYTSLRAGQPFVFTDSNYVPGHTTYTFDSDTGMYVVDGEPMTVAVDGVYRIHANIRYNRFEVEPLENLRLHYPAGIDVGGVITHDFPMEYQGDGVWKLADFRFEFTDNRYSFRVEVDGNSRVWGHNDIGVASPPSVTGGAYYYIYERYIGTDYDHSYRLMAELFGITTDIYVDMSTATPALTHRFDLVRPTEIPEVTTLTAPADDTSIDLNTPQSRNVIFSWQEPDYEKTFPAKYEVVFFGEATAETEILKVPAADFGMGTSVTLDRATLDNVAAALGADVGEVAVVYWGVRTVMMGDSAISNASLRKLSITRVLPPEDIYISGDATEQANVANALKLRKVEDGVFEGYWAFTNDAGGFRVTSGTTGTYITYGLVDGELGPAADGTTFPTDGFDSISATGRPYRITINFKTGTLTAQILRTVYIHFPARGRNTQMTYQGDGVWSSGAWDCGSGDSRYSIRVSYTTTSPVADGNAWVEKWSCSIRDTYPDPTLDNLEERYGGPAYYNVVTRIGRTNFYESNPGEADWDYSWKMVTGAGLTNSGTKTFTVYMNGGTGTGTTTGTITSTGMFHTY